MTTPEPISSFLFGSTVNGGYPLERVGIILKGDYLYFRALVLFPHPKLPDILNIQITAMRK